MGIPWTEILKIAAPVGATLGAGLIAGRRTDQERNALESQTGLSNTIADIARQQSQVTLPALNAATNYYMTLLGVAPSMTAPGSAVTVPGGQPPVQLTAPNVPGAFGRAAGGAASGAATGAAIGSIVPGVGTLIGAGVGALAGGIGGLFGRGRREANAIVPAQNYLTSEAERINNALIARRNAGTLTSQDLLDAQGYIQNLYGQFTSLAQEFGRAGPGAQESTSWVPRLLSDWGNEAGAMPPPSASGDAGATGTSGAPTGSTAPATLRQAQRLGAEQALAVPIQQLNEQYDAIRRTIEETMPPGGQRDQTLAQIQQHRARDIGQLFTALPGQAAAALGALATGTAPAVTQGFQSALYGYGNIAEQEANRRNSGFQTGVGIGNILGGALFRPRGENARQTAQQRSSTTIPESGPQPYIGAGSIWGR